MKISKALEGFRIDRLATGYSPATIKTYLSCLRLFSEYLGEIELDEISKDHLIDFFYYLRTEYQPRRFSGSTSPLSPASLDNYWISLRSFFKWVDEELEIENPSGDLPRPKYAAPEIAPLTREEIREAIKAATLTTISMARQAKSVTRKVPHADRNKAIILLLLDTGIRLGELCRLKMEDLDLEQGLIEIKPFGSSRKSRPRQIPLGNVARKAVWKYVSMREQTWPDDLVFGLDKRGVQSMLYRVKKRTGNDKIHAHRFRHTFAVEYLRNGGDIFTLQYFLGHSTLEMVKRYLYFATDDRWEMHRRASPADRWRL